MVFNLKSGLAWFGDQFAKKVMTDVDTKMRLTGERVVAKARELAPERTGALKAGLGYTYRQSDHTLSIHSDSGHGLFVELGTRFMAPQPHIRPAIASEVGTIWGGGKIEMEFANTTAVSHPILAHPGGKGNVLFKTPPVRSTATPGTTRITPKQLAHVRRHLVPTSERLRRNKHVRDAKLIVRHRPR
jgi:hypothetical protein